MKKELRKFISLLLAVTMAFSLTVSVHAEESNVNNAPSNTVQDGSSLTGDNNLGDEGENFADEIMRTNLDTVTPVEQTEEGVVEQTDEGAVAQTAEGAVAQIGEGDSAVTYGTLAEAIANAQANDTVTLLANVCLSEADAGPEIDKNLSINLGRFTLSMDSSLEAPNPVLKITENAEVTVSNGSIQSENGQAIRSYGTLALNGVSVYGGDCGIKVESGAVTIAQLSEISSDWNAIYVSNAAENAIVNIIDATVKAEGTGEDDDWFAAILSRGTNTAINIYDGAAITGGDRGICANRGDLTLNVSGGTISGTKALDVTTSGSANLAVTGGNFTGAISVPEGTDKFISGGTFSESDGISEYLADGYTVDDNGTVTKAKTPVAQVGDKEYPTLQEAVQALKSGEGTTLTLLDDVKNEDFDNVISISMPAGTVLEGNGHTLEGNISVSVNAAGGTVQNVNFKNIHNSKSQLSALYASGLTGMLTVTGCEFDTCDWDAIQTTPQAGAVVDIQNNTFRNTGAQGINTRRYVHVESAAKTDFTVTVTGNRFYDGDKLQETVLEVYYPTTPDKVTLSGNYAADPMNSCIIMNSGSTCSPELALPFVGEDMQTEITPQAGLVVSIYNYFYYLTVDQAIEAAKDNQKVTLLADVGEVTIGEGKTVTLAAGEHSAQRIINNGTLTLSSGTNGEIINNGTLKITGGTHTPDNITNNGTVSITGGTFTTKPDDSMLAEWYMAAPLEDGTGYYKVNKMTAAQALDAGMVASSSKSGGTFYKSVTDALAGGTAAYLQKDVEEEVNLTGSTYRSVYLNGHTFTGTVDMGTLKYVNLYNGSATLNHVTGTKLGIGAYNTQADVTIKNADLTTLEVAASGICTVEDGTYGNVVVRTFYSDSTADTPKYVGQLEITGGTFGSNVVTVTANYEAKDATASLSDYVPAEYTVVDNGDGTYTVQSCAVSVTDESGVTTYCTTLAEAIDAANAAAGAVTIKMLQDVSFDDAPYTVSGSNITLDLNGHTISGNEPSNVNKALIVTGNLTVQDNSAEQNGKITTHDAGTQPRVISVEETGTLTLESGKITTDGAAKASTAVYVSGGCSFTLKGGTVEAVNSSSIGVNCKGNTSAFTMENGTITAPNGTAVSGASSAPIKIQDGFISAKTAVSAPNSAIEISGGDFTGAVTTKKESISGGVYHGIELNPAYVVQDYIGIYDGNGTTIGQDAPNDYTASINGKLYYTNAGGGNQAIAKAVSGDTVTLRENADENKQLTAKGAALTIVKENGAVYTGTISAGTGYEIETAANGNAVTYTVVLTENSAQAKVISADGTETLYPVLTSLLASSSLKDGDKVVLLQDVNVGAASPTIKKSITLDLDGHMLTGTHSTNPALIIGSPSTASIDVTVKNGSITNANGAGVQVKYNNTVTLEDVILSGGTCGLSVGTTANSAQPTVTVTGPKTEITGGVTGIAVYSYNGAKDVTDSSTLNVENGIIRGGNYGIAGDGNCIKDSDAVITITGGIIESTAIDGAAIYHPQAGILNVSGGTITGATGIEMRAGTLNVTDANSTPVITGTATDFKCESNASGTTTAGAGIAVVEHTTNLGVTVNISGGNISGYYALYQNDIENSDAGDVKIHISGGAFAGTGDDRTALYSENCTGFVSGGIFSSRVLEKYCADGYVPTDADANGNYTVCNHATVETISAKKATCAKEGNIAYWYCQDCGRYFSDETLTTEILQSATVLPVIEHSFGEWKVVIAATETEKGEKQRVCSVCGVVEKAEIPATGTENTEMILDTIFETNTEAGINVGIDLKDDTRNALLNQVSGVLKDLQNGKVSDGVNADEAAKTMEILNKAAKDQKSSVKVIVAVTADQLAGVPVSEQSLMNSLRTKGEISALTLDLNVRMTVYVTYSDGSEENSDIALSLVEKPILFTVTIEPDLIAEKTVRIGHVHQGTAEIIPIASVDRSKGVITFYAEKFSTYDIMVADNPKETDVTNSDSVVSDSSTGVTVENTPANTPAGSSAGAATGDSAPIAMWLIIAFAAVVIGSVLIMKEKKKHR